MAISKSFLVFFIAALLFISMIQAQKSETVTNNNEISSTRGDKNIDCHKECERRCHLSSRPNLCHRACGTCCARCSCVPPGTYGNYETCPCYANMTTHGGRKKCP